VRGGRQTYPTEPDGYFGASALSEIIQFRLTVEKSPTLKTLQSFPYERLSFGLDGSWQFSASPIVKGWLTRVREPRKRHQTLVY